VDAWVVALLCASALAAGTIDAIAGGGGLITVPTLLAVGVPPHLALGTNKAQSSFGTAAALVTFWRRGAVTLRWIALGLPLGAAGAVVGALAVSAVPPTQARPLVLVMLVLASLALWLRRPAARTQATTAWWTAPVIAVLIGAYDGFFGPGTGTFLIVGLVTFAGRTPEHATAQAKAVNLGSNLAALGVFAAHGNIAWALAGPMAAAQVVGGVIGARLALRGGAATVKVMVTVVAAALWLKLAIDLGRAWRG
jgi:uncharacterized membrane protein YfcA